MKARMDGNLREEGGHMKRLSIGGVCLLCLVVSWAFASWVMAAQEAKVQSYEGQIKSVKVDKCGMQPGSCEGSIILAKVGGGEEVTLAIKPGTWLKRGTQLVTIDELGIGNHVKVEAVQLAGEPLQRITILSADQGD
jgi:hypothetical protein